MRGRTVTGTSGVAISKTRHGTWVWRCEGVGDCEGQVGTGLHTVTAAVREADRHVVDNHPAVEVPT